MSGVIGIVKSGFKEMDKGVYATLRWMALLSISLGVLNLLIIPPFDGSVILLGIVEMIMGKQQKLQDMFGQFAMIVLVFFMFITIKNDLFHKKNTMQEEVK
jgi:regulator of sigma E protease